MTKLLTFISIFLSITAFAQQELIQNGPMEGYIDMKEAAIWLQTTKPAEVFLAYYSVDNPKDVHYSNRVHTNYDQALTAHLFADTLEPGTTYHYDLRHQRKKTV